MCYAVYLSTDSDVDLSQLNSERVRFTREMEPQDAPYTPLLAHRCKWYVGSKSGCSCTFRHLHIEGGEPYFCEPKDWFEEDEDDIAATREFYRVVASLLSSGHRVDCIDVWEGARPEAIRTLSVSLDEAPEPAFRFFENHRFALKKGGG